MAADSLCSIPDCDKPAIKRGWCSAHYQRWRTYGDPNYAVRTPPGTVKKWLKDHISYDAAGCLPWPFSRSATGEPHMNYGDGKFGNATRFMCELVNGPAPSERHEVKMTCGVSGSGCVHPQHVFWAERPEPYATPIERDGVLYCGVPGCDQVVQNRGLCSGHLHRQHRHGAPMAGGTGKNAVREWLDEHAGYKGRSCLIWPFARNSLGYAICDAKLGSGIATKVMCRMAHGEPPSPLHEAAHSCGNGAGGCINPNHLSWKTHADNMADTLLHGTHNRGERNGCAKLTETDVREIRASVEPQSTLAERHGISFTYVYQIRKRLRWQWLK